MLKVIIADDEMHIRSLLRYLIHWEELGLEPAGEFDNGRDVVAVLRAVLPPFLRFGGGVNMRVNVDGMGWKR